MKSIQIITLALILLTLSNSDVKANGDNLGNHLATQTLNLNGNDLTNASNITTLDLDSTDASITNLNTTNFSASNSTIHTLFSNEINATLLRVDSKALFTNNAIAQFNGTASFADSVFINGGGPVDGYVLTSDATGLATWQPAPTSAGDNLGNHKATQTLDMDGNTIYDVGYFQADQIFAYNATILDLDVKTFQINDNVSNIEAGYILTADDNQGNASWQPAPGDNLGNHKATQTLDLNGNDLNNVNNANFMSLYALLLQASEIQSLLTTSLVTNGIEANFSDTFTTNFTAFNSLTNYLQVNGTASFTDTVFINGGGPVDGYVLTSDATGLATWQPAPAAPGDNLGNHKATQTLDLNGNDLENIDQLISNVAFSLVFNGSEMNTNNLNASKAFIDNGSFDTINSTIITSQYFGGPDANFTNLDVNNFQLRDSNVDGYILTADNQGNASWQPAPAAGASSSGTTGAIQFSDGSGGFDSDAPDFFWSPSNNYAVIGDATKFHTAIGPHAASAAKVGTQYLNAIGRYAARYANGDNINAFGYNAARNVIGNNINALGRSSAHANKGSNVNALGYAAAQYNTQADLNAMGPFAARYNNGRYVNALGREVARNNTAHYLNALGYRAAYSNTGAYTNALGREAAQYNTASHAHLVGYRAGRYNSGTGSIGIGRETLENNQGRYSIAIGYMTGDNTMNGQENILLGYNEEVVDTNASYQMNLGGLLYGNTNTKELNIGFATANPDATLEVGNALPDYIDGTNDVLIADDLEVDGDAYVEGDLTVVGNLNASGNFSGNFDGSISGPYTQGSVLFADGSPATISEDHDNFFWNSSRNRLGLGTNNPIRTLHISDTMRIEPRSDAPSAASLGDLYVDSDTSELCFYNGTAWVGITSAGLCQ